MATNKKTHPQVYLKQCRQELQEADAAGDQAKIAAAHANLGFALFNIRKNDEGMFHFDQSLEAAESLGDAELLKHCLNIKALAFQTIGRLPDAYKTVDQIRLLAEENHDQEMKCDALLSLGQILLDSGEPIIALERYQEAKIIAEELNDKRRKMNVMGTFGNYSLHMAATDNAHTYFAEARQLAREIGDKKAEIGFLGNEATILAYHGLYPEAARAFESVLAYVHAARDVEAELQALHHLIQVYEKIGQQERVADYAQKAITICETNNEIDQLYDFYQAYILACYQMGLIDAADAATEAAITVAQSDKNRSKEVDFLLSLGESSLNSGLPQKALDAYLQAKNGAVRLSRQKDDAYLTGRIGIALAELGRIDEAVAYHKDAVALAQRRDLPHLEGEQLSMLAVAYLDKGDRAEARTYGQSAIDVFTGAEMAEEAEQAKRLLAEIGEGEE